MRWWKRAWMRLIATPRLPHIRRSEAPSPQHAAEAQEARDFMALESTHVERKQEHLRQRQDAAQRAIERERAIREAIRAQADAETWRGR